MLVIGHRGAAGEIAENTLASFRYAIAGGADGIEFDVRLLGEQLIVLHDDTLERTTNGVGAYQQLDVTALRALKTTNGEPIPFLEEVLALAGSGALVNVEIKQSGIAKRVVETVNHFADNTPQWRSRVLYSSFDHATTRALADLVDPQQLAVLCGSDYQTALASAQELAAWSIHLPLDLVSEDCVAEAHAARLRVLVYTVNELHELAHCMACGVDGVFSDFPARATAYVQRSQSPTG